jgi:hypothetical protein
VIERNIRTIIDLRQQAARARGVQDRLADTITAFSGRMGVCQVVCVNGRPSAITLGADRQIGSLVDCGCAPSSALAPSISA